MKVTCTAEKPSVAKDIAKVIIGKYSISDGYYYGHSNLLDADVRVTWTYGHLCTLKNPHDYNPKWKYWNYNDLPVIPSKFQIKLIDNDGVKKQFNNIKSCYEWCDYIVNCGDAGQEGEVIQRYVIQKSGVKKPVKRLWISSLTDESILKGFKNLQDSSKYDKLYEAGLSRAICDWIVGMNATRYYSIKNPNKGVLSVGRVQTPTLAMIVERDNEIENFVPEIYNNIVIDYKKVQFSNPKKYTKEEAQKYLDTVKNDNFKITKITQKESRESAPKLFDLTSLQVEMNKRYKYTAEFTLKTIQSLYEKKFTTYPRVDTTYLPDDIYSECPDILRSLIGYKEYTKEILDKTLKKSKKVFDSKKVTDHHAIIPTKNVPYNITEAESNVYDAIVKRFISVFYDDMISSVTTIEGKLDSSKEVYKATGKSLISLGWYVVYNRKLEGKLLPDFKKDETGSCKKSIVEHTTTPPSQYTEATLLRAMETSGKNLEDESLRELMKENGIGRPSTRAAIIETLFKRNYIARDKNNLVATTKGIELINSIKNPVLKSPELTGQWESRLRKIERSEDTGKSMIDDTKNMINDLITL